MSRDSLTNKNKTGGGRASGSPVPQTFRLRRLPIDIPCARKTRPGERGDLHHRIRPGGTFPYGNLDRITGGKNRRSRHFKRDAIQFVIAPMHHKLIAIRRDAARWRDDRFPQVPLALHPRLFTGCLAASKIDSDKLLTWSSIVSIKALR